jgi:dTDP-4-amino-4,6-dideoxygalactose transaminase
MNIPIVNLQRMWEHLNKDFNFKNKILQEFASANYIMGQAVTSFENNFAGYCGVKYGIGVGCGTDALRIALMGLGIGQGDYVAVPAFTFIATAFAVSSVGAVPVFIDVKESNLTMNPVGLITEFQLPDIGEKIKAVIPVHLYGQPAEMEAINTVAENYGAFVIEDCAQAHGAMYKGKRVGSWGDVGCFSFYPSKNLGACGDGGMIATDDEKLAEKCSSLRNYGRPSGLRYVHEEVGLNSRLDSIQAFILDHKLKLLDEHNQRRKYNAFLYSKYLPPVVITPNMRPDCQNPIIPIHSHKQDEDHVYHLFVIRVNRRDELQAYLKDQGISTAVHYPEALHQTPAYQHSPCSHTWCLGASTRAAKQVLSLPMDPYLTEEEIKYICFHISLFYKMI